MAQSWSWDSQIAVKKKKKKTGHGSDDFKKNLNPTPLFFCFLFFRYADQQYEKALKGVTMYFFNNKFSSQEEANCFAVKAGQSVTVHA